MKARMWGGFTNGKLHAEHVKDGYGSYWRPAIFTNRKDAKKQYQDVRPLLLSSPDRTGA